MILFNQICAVAQPGRSQVQNHDFFRISLANPLGLSKKNKQVCAFVQVYAILGSIHYLGCSPGTPIIWGVLFKNNNLGGGLELISQYL